MSSTKKPNYWRLNMQSDQEIIAEYADKFGLEEVGMRWMPGREDKMIKAMKDTLAGKRKPIGPKEFGPDYSKNIEINF